MTNLGVEQDVRPLREAGARLDRASRLLVVCGAGSAVAAMAVLGAPEWPALLPLTLSATGAMVVLGRARPGLAGWASLPFLYCSAALILGVVGHSRNAYQAPIAGAILGLALSTGFHREWAVPARWRVPLAWWGAAMILGAGAVVLRELDFTPSLMRGSERLANGSFGGPPWVITAWIAYLTASTTVGILWMDSFFARYRDLGATAFRDQVVLPLGLGLVASAGIAIYQGLVDITWLSGHAWAYHARAAGGLVDGDAFGALAGFWTGVFLAVAASGRWRMRLLGVAGTAISWGGLWASGSRMALVAGALSTVGALVAFSVPSMRRHPARVAGTAATVVVVLMSGWFYARSVGPAWQTDSPLSRTLQSLPGADRESLEHFVEHQLWNRGAPFGTAFLWIMHDYPVTGIGVGSFHTQFADYARRITSYPGVGTPENAQSWYRHQLVELGVLGSIGWVWWLGLVVVLIARRTPLVHPTVGCLKAVLLTVAMVSAVSMPTQHLAVSLTVWPLLFWLISLSPEAQRVLRAPAAPSRRAWRVMFGGVLTFTVLTLAVGWYSLRPPQRALRSNWTYSRGFFGVEAGDYSRWSAKYAVEVPHAPARWMRLGIGGGGPDVGSNPVRVVVRRNGDEILTHVLTDWDTHEWWIRVPQGPPRVMIEIEVDRTWSPADFGGTDTRELGVSVLPWIFADVPPRDARAIN